jgi:GntR family transcriptional regulator
MSVTMCCVAIDSEGAEYLYMQLAADLRDRCAAGEWPRGHRIPGIPALAAEYHVAAMTVRKAVAILAGEGVLVTRPGRGTFRR